MKPIKYRHSYAGLLIENITVFILRLSKKQTIKRNYFSPDDIRFYGNFVWRSDRWYPKKRTLI